MCDTRKEKHSVAACWWNGGLCDIRCVSLTQLNRFVGWTSRARASIYVYVCVCVSAVGRVDLESNRSDIHRTHWLFPSIYCLRISITLSLAIRQCAICECALLTLTQPIFDTSRMYECFLFVFLLLLFLSVDKCIADSNWRYTISSFSF